ncbi:uncharacterized protein EAF02_006903 [Botrytis sinoallii]|uniref:uncharacterized protein n=1 Tax=Botrytis sinoallii TaxID=1463999 RepID=UPI0019004C00|nr:uncharacterized protein EAF02_006903 [Botrytis sinoallii]KAF7881012.1 hypothetical protein EAF02_006903 [Botrytis sinoallii]
MLEQKSARRLIKSAYDGEERRKRRRERRENSDLVGVNVVDITKGFFEFGTDEDFFGLMATTRSMPSNQIIYDMIPSPAVQSCIPGTNILGRQLCIPTHKESLYEHVNKATRQAKK